MSQVSGNEAKRPRTARGEATRTRLLESAERRFGSAGFHATGIADITRDAGVAQGTFYLYFDSKEEVFRALVLNLSHELRLALHRATEGVDGRLAKERAGIRAFLEFSAAHHDLYRIVFESQFIDPGLIRWYYERIAEGYTRGLRQAIEAGEVRAGDAETMAYCLMGASHFLGMRWVIWEGREPPAEVMDTVQDFIAAALAPTPAGESVA